MSRYRRERKERDQFYKASVEKERWLITYADLITLVMIFFILMYAMSQLDVKKFSSVSVALSGILTGNTAALLDYSGPSIVEGESGQMVLDGVSISLQNQAQLDEAKESINQFIDSRYLDNDVLRTSGASSAKLSEYITVYEQERGLVISIKDTLLFASGSDELNPIAQAIIQELGGALRFLPNFIRVEGHTDDLPINTAIFPSNWELSVMRSANVVHILQDDVGIPAENISIIGYGEYRPLLPNEDESSRAMNRRVDIVVLKQKYDYFEAKSYSSDQ